MLAKTLSYSQARANFAETLNDVEDNRSIVIVRRANRPGVALISADELSSMMETVHLLRSPANARRLFDAIDRAEAEEGEPCPDIHALARELGFGQEES
ncbi:type II toxin-antitoxin system Phd/YefM family antitoxin [Synechococcus sp. PCC 7336]|uniref:type II toxin-antitoxin system Phd/YefM family antitoxin n=1 Tax=Synechococcus sp. PCC 7336 TaxID=195250 RepID=UPI000347B15E|nr:type II toxin-antitoxin system prevent-host-death family antitoxin [Synechococcus sp. PCC 7336]